MKPGGGKRKGNGYEIIISKILSKWYVKNFIPRRYRDKKERNTDFFWRTAGSGAKSTINRSSQTSFTGDITFLPAPDRLKIWIDCKDVKTITFDNILSGKFLPERWHKEEVEKMDALGMEKPVVIIFKLYRRKENYILFSTADFEYMFTRSDNLVRMLKYHVMLFEDFLYCVPKEDILE